MCDRTKKNKGFLCKIVQKNSASIELVQSHEINKNFSCDVVQKFQELLTPVQAHENNKGVSCEIVRKFSACLPLVHSHEIKLNTARDQAKHKRKISNIKTKVESKTTRIKREEKTNR